MWTCANDGTPKKNLTVSLKIGLLKIISTVKIKSSVFYKSSSKPKEFPVLNIPRFAFIGRSNVGKSSLINMLIQRKNLARTFQ